MRHLTRVRAGPWTGMKPDHGAQCVTTIFQLHWKQGGYGASSCLSWGNRQKRMRFTWGLFRIIKLGFEQTKMKSNSREQGEVTKLHASQLADSGQSRSDQRDTFASCGDFIDLSSQSSISCRCHTYHIADQWAWFSCVLLGSSPSHPSQWRLREACTACPKEALGLLGNSTFFSTSIIAPIFMHFITLDFLFYFRQFCYCLCFHFQRIIFSSFFPLHMFFLHSVSHLSFLLSPITSSALETTDFPSSFFLLICRQLLFLTQQFL